MRVAQASVDAFLEGHRFGLVGASPKPDSFSHTIADSLIEHGYEVVPINPHHEAIGESTCFGSVTDVPGHLDGVIVMVPAQATPAVVQECLDAGVDNIWLFQGIGRGSVDDTAVARCTAAGINVVPGACPLMFLEPVGSIHRLHRGIRRLRGSLRDQAVRP